MTILTFTPSPSASSTRDLGTRLHGAVSICKIHAQLGSHSTGLIKAVLLLAMKTRKTRRKTSRTRKQFVFVDTYRYYYMSIGPLQLAIHVVQNSRAGEQKSHRDKTNKENYHFRLIYVCLLFVLSQCDFCSPARRFCTTWMASKGPIVISIFYMQGCH